MTSGAWPTTPPTFLALDPSEHSLERSRWVILPVPYEATTSYRKGTQAGPAAIIRASAEMEDYDPELGHDPCDAGIHTAPPIEPALAGPDAMARRVADAVGAYADAGKLVGMLGGEHSISSGAVAALAERRPGLSVLVFDAQADLRDEYQGAAHSHACATRRMLDHAQATIVGVRSMTGDEAAFAAERGVPLFPRGAAPITDIDAIIDTLAEDVYVSFDLDAFDPSFMAAVGTPEPGGMGWWEALRILRAVGGAPPHRGLRRRRALARRGSRGVRVYSREAGVQAHRLRVAWGVGFPWGKSPHPPLFGPPPQTGEEDSLLSPPAQTGEEDN